MYDPINKDSYSDILREREREREREIEIAEFLSCNLLTRKQLYTGNEYFTLTASSRKSLLTILNYF